MWIAAKYVLCGHASMLTQIIKFKVTLRTHLGQ